MLNRPVKSMIVRWSVLFFLAFPALLAADQKKWCGQYDPLASHPLAWHHLADEISAHLSDERYEDAYRFVIDVYAAHYGAEDETLLRELREKLASYLERRERLGERPSDWKSILVPVNNTENLMLDSSERLVALSCDSDAWTGTASPEVAAFYAAAAIERAAEEGIAAAHRLAAQRADLTRRTYQDWLYNGLAMWPWEMKLNELWVDKDFAQAAPGTQITLLRPNLSAAILPDGFEDSELNYALTLELVGYVRYFEESGYRKWWGISPMITVSSDNGAGYGVLGRYNEFTFGAAYHGSNDEVMLYFSIDLYRHLLGEDGMAHRVNALLNR